MRTLVWAALTALALGQVAQGGETEPKYRLIYLLGTAQHEQPAGLVEGTPGVFYTSAGGVLLFSFTKRGGETDVATFRNPPQTLQYGQVAGANGRIYGSYETGGGGKGGYCSGTVFSAGADGSREEYAPSDYSVVFSQNLPDGSLLGWAIRCPDGTYHLVRSDLKGVVTAFYDFAAGHRPGEALYAPDGNFYGTVDLHDGSGYVWRVDSAGEASKVRSFAAPGVGALLIGDDGNLYGTTPPSAQDAGTVFRLAPSGEYKTLYRFPAGEGGDVNAMIEAGDGMLYGAAGGPSGRESHLFRIGKDGSYRELYKMRGVTGDGACPCSLTQGSDGLIYGTLSEAGPLGRGGIFTLDVGLGPAPPRALRMEPGSGPVGTVVRIWGRNLWSASVSFGGARAREISARGANYVSATVPAGAKSGAVTVTTAGGTSTAGMFAVTRK